MIQDLKKLAAGIVILSLLALSGCTATGPTKESDAAYFNNMGMAFMREGKTQLAYVEFQRALQKDPDHKEANYNLGLVSFQLEDYEGAKKYFVKAVSVNPDFPDAHNNLGVACLQLGQWGEAAESFKRAIANKLYKTPHLAYYSLGKALYRLGQYDKAIEAYKDSIRRNREFSLPYYGMALVYNKLQRYGEASEILTQGILIDSDYKGDKAKKAADLRQQAYTAKGEEEQDIRDLLEIMQY